MIMAEHIDHTKITLSNCCCKLTLTHAHFSACQYCTVIWEIVHSSIVDVSLLSCAMYCRGQGTHTTAAKECKPYYIK